MFFSVGYAAGNQGVKICDALHKTVVFHAFLKLIGQIFLIYKQNSISAVRGFKGFFQSAIIIVNSA